VSGCAASMTETNPEVCRGRILLKCPKLSSQPDTPGVAKYLRTKWCLDQIHDVESPLQTSSTMSLLPASKVCISPSGYTAARKAGTRLTRSVASLRYLSTSKPCRINGWPLKTGSVGFDSQKPRTVTAGVLAFSTYSLCISIGFSPT
jgi:hypothetical protein